MKDYFLFNEVGCMSSCSRGSLLQSTCSDGFAEDSTEELCEEARGAGAGTARLPAQLQGGWLLPED